MTKNLPPVEERRRMLAEMVYVNRDHGYVAFGQMTVEQHEARIQFLEKLRGGRDES